MNWQLDIIPDIILKFMYMSFEDFNHTWWYNHSSLMNFLHMR